MNVTEKEAMDALKKLLISTKAPRENKSATYVLPFNTYDHVYPGIILGNRKLAQDLGDLSANKVTHILNCSQGKGFGQVDTDDKFYEGSGIRFMGIPAKDVQGYTLSDHFTQCADFIDQSLQAGGTIYVHCNQGISRSATITIAFLMLRRGMNVMEAAKTIRVKRPVLPNNGFLRQLCQLNNELSAAVPAGSLATNGVEHRDSTNAGGTDKLSVDKIKTLLAATKTQLELTSKVHTTHYDEVYAGVILGNRNLATDLTDLSAKHVTHVLNCCQGRDFGQVDTCDKFYEESGIKFLGIPAQDDDEFDLSDHFCECAEFIESCLQTGGTAYVHCHQGLSRSAAVVIAFLMLKKGMSVQEAARTVCMKRPVQPNDGFIEQLCDLNAKLFPSAGADCQDAANDNSAETVASSEIPPLIFFDLETTGLERDSDITQIAARCGDKTFDCYVMPTKPIHPKASEVTGLSVRDNALHHHSNRVDTKSTYDALCDFLAFIRQFEQPLLIAHNAKYFDASVLHHHVRTLDLKGPFEIAMAGFLDTWLIAKDKLRAARYGQQYLVETYVGKSYDAHNAVHDVLALSELYAARLVLDAGEIQKYKFGFDEANSI